MASKKTIKPFTDPGFTMVNNHIFDYIMPRLRPNAWKVLCVAIRQTLGWEDKTTENGRKEEDEISYSQFINKTGIGSKSTLSAAIKECLGKKYLKRREAGRHPGTNKPIYIYRLNKEYEMEIPGTESVLESASTENGPGASTESVPASENPNTESVPTKETLSKKKRKEISSAPSADKRPNGLLPDTKSSRTMFGRLQANAKTEGRKGPCKFRTLEQKRKFDQAAAKLDEQEFDRALTAGLEQGINSVARMTNWVAKWDGNRQKSPRNDPDKFDRARAMTLERLERHGNQ